MGAACAGSHVLTAEDRLQRPPLLGRSPLVEVEPRRPVAGPEVPRPIGQQDDRVPGQVEPIGVAALDIEDEGTRAPPLIRFGWTEPARA
jgi:hypothetical protein